MIDEEDDRRKHSSPVLSVGDELRKPHEMIVMLPRSGRITLTGRRLYNAMLHVAQTQMVGMDEMPTADFLFTAPLLNLLRSTGSSGEDRTAAKRYLREMRGLEVDWESTAAGDGIKWKGFSMLSEVSIELKNGENWVSWSYPPTLMAALREPTRWARFDLEILGKLGTYASLALYEICARYRDNPSGLTSRKPVTWWADALSNTPAGGERREWRKFKSERLKQAITEINNETDLEIELVEHKQGRTIEEAQFTVRRKRNLTKTPKNQSVDLDIVRRATNLAIREIKLDGLLQEFGDEAVRQCLAHVEQRIANRRLRPIENTYSYLRTLLRNGGIDPGVYSNENNILDLHLNDAMTSKIIDPDSRSISLIKEQRQEQSNLEGERYKQLRAELNAMDPIQRQGFVSQAIKRLTESGLFTPVIRRRAEQGDPLHGILGSMVIKCYSDSLPK